MIFRSPLHELHQEQEIVATDAGGVPYQLNPHVLEKLIIQEVSQIATVKTVRVAAIADHNGASIECQVTLRLLIGIPEAAFHIRNTVRHVCLRVAGVKVNSLRLSILYYMGRNIMERVFLD